MGKGIKGMNLDLTINDEATEWEDPVGDIKRVVREMRSRPAVFYPLRLPLAMKEAYIGFYGEPPEGAVVWE
jgi:hypothetical protein